MTDPLAAVIVGQSRRAGDGEAAAQASAIPGTAPIQLYKNNTDNKGASYGCHENYLMSRATPFAEIVRYLTPFFVTRQVICGAGRVGRGADGREDGFQISQRADFFEVEVGLETTLKRPIINTRDEPHADPEKYRRLHVIIGDANMSELSTYLKLGTTALVLSMIEDRFLDDRPEHRRRRSPSCARSRTTRPAGTWSRCGTAGSSPRSRSRWSTWSWRASTRRSGSARTSTSSPPTCSTAGSPRCRRWPTTRCGWPASSTG